MGLKGIIDLPVFEHNRFGFYNSLLRLGWLVRRDHVEELLRSAAAGFGAELLVQLRHELLLRVLLGRARAHKVAQRLDRLRDKRQRSVCLYVLQNEKK